MATNFDRAVAILLDEEGGTVNDPQDPGGLTRWGISQRTHPELDVAALTREDAIRFYREDYWPVVHGEELPPAVGLVLLDAAVNQGPRVAIRLFQTALGVRVDGIIGPETIEAAWQHPVAEMVTDFQARRLLAYARLPIWPRFGLGWARRALRVHLAALTKGA